MISKESVDAQCDFIIGAEPSVDVNVSLTQEQKEVPDQDQCMDNTDHDLDNVADDINIDGHEENHHIDTPSQPKSKSKKTMVRDLVNVATLKLYSQLPIDSPSLHSETI